MKNFLLEILSLHSGLSKCKLNTKPYDKSITPKAGGGRVY
jgi:hypothetical protein